MPVSSTANACLVLGTGRRSLFDDAFERVRADRMLERGGLVGVGGGLAAQEAGEQGIL